KYAPPITRFPVWMAAIFKLTHDQLLRSFSAVPKFSGRKTRFLWYDICFQHGLGCEMAISRLLRNSRLKPEQISRLEAAYEQALHTLCIKDRDDPLTEMVAKKIIKI